MDESPGSEEIAASRRLTAACPGVKVTNPTIGPKPPSTFVPMVSSQHEAMHHLFRQDPGIFARTFRKLGLTFPDPIDISELPTDLTEIQPVERRIDTLLRVDTAEGAFLLLVEAQRQDKEEKISAWAYYLAHVYAKYDIPPVLLVITQDTKTATWARGPLCIGPPQWTSLAVHPVVFGPDNIPAVTDYKTAAKDIPLATLSAITHAEQADIDDIIKALATAVKTTESTDPALFIELTTRGLGDSPAGEIWRQLMTVDTSFFQSQIFQDVRAEGRAEGEAASILRILDHRKIPVPEDIRNRINTCTDLDQLTTWLDRAIDAKTIDDLFE